MCQSVRSIRRRLCHAPSTIRGEITRNRGATTYRALDADDRTWRRVKRTTARVLAQRPTLCAYVADRLREDWSPAQIAGTLHKLHPVLSVLQVSHETMYQSLFIESRGVLARELCAHLRSGRPMRRSVHNTVIGQRRCQIKGAVSIADRPAEMEDRAIPGRGKVICCWADIARNSRPSSNAPPALRCSYHSHDATCTR
jgi:IS30 family transposase